NLPTSPSHAIRADADPLARSATSVVITLADKYTYDCPVRILIYPSEPHLPHVLIENGDMTLDEYDEYLHGRSDFIKATKKDSSNARKVSDADVLQRRLHKDILHHPVVMLNFCPDLKSVSSDLRKVHGEFIFLIDRSGSMSGDAMVVMLKSLMPGCFFNIVGFGSTYKSLFSTSQSYDEVTMPSPVVTVQTLWILRQPMIRGHPRLLFLLTDGAISNTGRVIQLVRGHARYIRCFTFSIGQTACRRLVEALATVSKGTAEFLADGERLQPKMLKSLKKTMSAVLSDISIEWLFPEAEEVLLSPVGNTFLFPGDSLIGYSVVCDTNRYHANPKSVSDIVTSFCLSCQWAGRSVDGLPYRALHHIHHRAVQGSRGTSPLQRKTLQGLHVCVSDCYGHQVCQAETPQEALRSDLGADQPKGDCKVVVSGLLCGKPAKWEVLFDIRPFLSGREREEKVHEELWNETFHYLAGRSIIHDFEHMAEKECEIEHGELLLGQRRSITGYTGTEGVELEPGSTGFPGSTCLLGLLGVLGLLGARLCIHNRKLSVSRLVLQVLLQLASGAFPLDPALCETISVPMDKLKWTSPFSSHRSSLGHVSQSSSRRADAGDDRQEQSQSDSGGSSGSGGSEIASPSCPGKRMLDPESMIWATAVALAWLEHSSASYFIEWEMIAAKASMWLSAQDIPEGRDLASIKAAANQLFIILRHWDENLQLNMLCYNPNSV
uniref:von Willebrand factor A domain containing 5B1 n=1 Tax=Takifugu rubripes TaxID=31033 RepID=A0A674ME48_TAKRU